MPDTVLVHPNRDKAESKATRAVVVLLLVTSAVLILVVTALAILFAVVAAVAAPAWFERDKAGFDDPGLDPSMLGLLTAIIVPVQLLMIAFAMRGFQQQWNVEVEVAPGDEAIQPA